MPKALGGMTSPLCMGCQLLDLLGIGWAHDLQLDGYVLEIRRRVVDAVLLGVPKSCPDVGGRVIDRYLVEWREPRQLGEQSKRRPHHQELERGRSLLGATAHERLIRLDRELAHAALEVDVVDDLRDCSRRDRALLGRFGAHLRAQALDLVHLLVEIYTPPSSHWPKS